MKKIAQSPNKANGVNGGFDGAVSPTAANSGANGGSEGWSPFEFFFSSGLVGKCDVCTKRLGWKPVLECDDCGLR